MANVAICDDSETIIYEWQNALNRFFQRNDIEASIDLFTQPAHFIEACREKEYDLIFLDILMPEVDGFKVAQTLRQSGSRANIAFFSYVTDFIVAQDAFLYKPVAYIKKKTLADDLEKYENSILHALLSQSKYYIYTLSDRTHRIKINDIYYFQSKGKYIYIYTAVSSKPVELKKTLKRQAEKMPIEAFYKRNGYTLQASLKYFYAAGDPKQIYAKTI